MSIQRNLTVHYSIYIPCGNDTALVEGTSFSPKEKKWINDAIMKMHTNVEQVGFVEKVGPYRLIMAGGEFCGNATRCAAFHYLKGALGEIEIEIAGVRRLIKAGIDETQNAWSQIPIYSERDVVTQLKQGIYKVKMEGITHVVVEAELAKEYLGIPENLKKNALDLIKDFDIDETEALGILFLEEINQEIKIHPIVWVKSIDTVFYESACGSGSVAVAILESIRKKTSQSLKIMQPSGQVIRTSIIMENQRPMDAFISGKVYTDGVVRIIDIDFKM